MLAAQVGIEMDIVRSAREGCVVLSLIGVLDLSKLEALDPGCATVFAAVAHRPRNRWPDDGLVLCCAQPAVAAVQRRLRPPHLLPYSDTLDEAIGAARWFAAEVSRRWGLDAATEAAQLIAVQEGTWVRWCVLRHPT